MSHMCPSFHGTTILAIRHRGCLAMAGDGQITLGDAVVKHGARKVRKLYRDTILAGFAGSAADAMSLFGRFEAKLEEYRGNLGRAAVELVKDWRTDRALRRLEALLVVGNRERTYLLSGTGELIEPDDGLLSIGSGGSCALAAARALVAHTDMSAADIARESMRITAGIDIYTNDTLVVEEI
ncbi:MAG: ATP-dependent protease subunit HslV [Acidobacteriota bacterium]